MKRLKYVAIALGLQATISAQNDSIPPQKIDTVFIQSSRIKATVQKFPAAISIYKSTANDETRQQLSLQEYVQQMPGVFTQNVHNFAQDLRISIRGFGARSSFGIRGIKLIVDGIPETTPDGQGQLDNLNLGIIERIEVLKGTHSSLYGNASGGVINIKTIQDFEKPFSIYKASIGAFGFQNYQVTAGIQNRKNNYIFHANYGLSNGYRDQSGFVQLNTNFKGVFNLNPSIKLTAILNYSDSPEAQDPGGLTLEEINQNRRQARQNNIDFMTEEAVTQLKVGTHLEWQKSKNTLVEAYGFYSNRQFDGLLPFQFGGIVDLNRNYLGQGISFNYNKGKNKIRLGYDLGYQNDLRQRFENLNGEQGAQTLDQKERFAALGVYITDHFEYDNWFLTGGLRYDYNRLVVEDQFIANGDDSGSRNLSSLSGNVGISYALVKNLNIYGNLSTSFETPTLSELSANPTGEQGFNSDLKPQKAVAYELGIKHNKRTLQYSVTGFLISTRDDLVPFEQAEFPDRDFFRNAGKTKRLGVEMEAQYAFAKAWKGIFSYTYTDFTYDEFVIEENNLSGNSLPGIPKHFTTLGLAYGSDKDLQLHLNANLVGSQFANDNNNREIEGYELLNVRGSYALNYRKALIKPYIGINNLLDQEYTDNVRINAFGGRFYEPAPGFYLYGGIGVKL